MEEILFTWKIGDEVIEEQFRPFSEETLWKERRYADGEIAYGEIKRQENKIYAIPYEFSLTDYICEAHASSVMQQYKNWYDRFDVENNDSRYMFDREFRHEEIRVKTKKSLRNDILIEIAIELARWDLSILTQIDFLSRDEELEEKICTTIEMLQGYLTNYQIGVPIQEKEEDAKELKRRIQEINNYSSNSQIIDIMAKIENWVNRLSSLSNLSEHEFVVFSEDMDKLVRTIPQMLGPGNKRRARELRGIYSHYYNNDLEWRNEIQLLSISKLRYESKREEIKNDICKKVQALQHNLADFDDIINDDYDTKLLEVEKFFEGKKIGGIWNTKKMKQIMCKYSDGGGCFAIMHTQVDDYFALSGRQDYSGGVWDSVLDVSSEIEQIAKTINSALFANKYIWARLSDSTRRYTNLHNHGEDPSAIHRFVELGTDWNNPKVDDKNTIGTTYGCCERKLQAAHNDYLFDKDFYVRWAPCKRCIPALADEKGISRIFTIAFNYPEWINFRTKKASTDSALQEYEVTYGLRRVNYGRR